MKKTPKIGSLPKTVPANWTLPKGIVDNKMTVINHHQEVITGEIQLRKRAPKIYNQKMKVVKKDTDTMPQTKNHNLKLDKIPRRDTEDGSLKSRYFSSMQNFKDDLHEYFHTKDPISSTITSEFHDISSILQNLADVNSKVGFKKKLSMMSNAECIEVYNL